MSADTSLADAPIVPAETTATRWRVNPVLLALPLLLLAIALGWYSYTSGYEETDDAQVDGHLNPVASRIDGVIKTVYVDDNQTVSAGALLVQLDPADDEIAIDQKRAQYDQAVAQLGSAGPNLPMTRIKNLNDIAAQRSAVAGAEAALAAAQQDLESTLAKLREAQAVNQRNQADFSRYRTLFEKQEVARAEYDQYRALASAQTQTVAANQAAVASARKTVEQRGAQVAEERSKLQQTQSSGPLQIAIREADIKGQRANAEAARAALKQGDLNLTYGRIVAPVSGIITQRNAEIGERISKGQQLFIIVQTSDLWVTANFKETQLSRIHPGQHVLIHVDALHTDLEGSVESMPAVTGSRTSVLPPENATGNYVKVVQRLPVRIRFNQGQKALEKLRPGMSVEPKVRLD